MLTDVPRVQGWACSECAPAFYRDDDRLCQECNSYVWILYIIGFLLAMTMAPLLMRISKSQGFMSVNIFVASMQITTQIQKLELDWPPQIRNFFAMLNLLSLSFSSLSPRCVLSDWQYLNKIPMLNAAPLLIFLFLLAHQYFVSRLHYLCSFAWAKFVSRATTPQAASDRREKVTGVPMT